MAASEEKQRDTGRAPAALPRTVVALGFISLLMDISSEMIHALLPLFLVSSLGASVALVGLLEGIAEATAAMTKLFSGVISDWIGRRKPLILLGYALAAFTKPLFPLAAGLTEVLPRVSWIALAKASEARPAMR